MSSAKEEGNLLSFRIFFNKKGLLMSEYRSLPLREVPKFFKEEEERVIIEKIIDEGLRHLNDMHEKIELELSALNTKLDT